MYAKKRAISTPKEAQFWMSVEAGDLNRVASLLQEDPSLVNLPNTTAHDEGHFPLTYAAHKADHHLLHLLLLCSAMVNAPGKGVSPPPTPPHTGRGGAWPIVGVGGREGGRGWLCLPPTHTGRGGIWPLVGVEWVIERDFVMGGRVVVWWVSYAPPLPSLLPRVGPSGNTALHLAAQKGDMVATVKLLLAYGADAAARNAYGETPIHCAAQRGEAEMVGLMVQQVGGSVAGMETYRMKRGPLHLAAGGGAHRGD